MTGYSPDEPCRPLSDIGWPADIPLVEPAWRTLDVLRLAGSIRATRNLAALPVLADALEEAGCNNQYLLGHCRDPGPHRPDCWVVEAILVNRPSPEPRAETLVEAYKRRRAVESEAAAVKRRAAVEHAEWKSFMQMFVLAFVLFLSAPFLFIAVIRLLGYLP